MLPRTVVRQPICSESMLACVRRRAYSSGGHFEEGKLTAQMGTRLPSWSSVAATRVMLAAAMAMAEKIISTVVFCCYQKR